MENFGQADYNDAIGYLNRINICFWNANKAAAELAAVDWYYALHNLYRELSGYFVKDDWENFYKQFAEIEKTVFATSKGKIPFLLFRQLEYLEVSLRQVYKKSGLMIREKQIPALME